MKEIQPDFSRRIEGNDITGLVYLLGELVNPCDPVRRRRHVLLSGLAEWIGADAWFRLRHGGDACQEGLEPGAWRRFEKTASPDLPAETVAVRLAMGSILHRCRQDAEGTVHVAFLRRPAQAPFSVRETKLADILLDEVAWLYEDGSKPTAPDALPPLSPRQATIVDLLLQGQDRKRIAGQLEITPNTLAAHIKNIYRRLGVRSHAGLLKVLLKGSEPDSPSS